MRTDEIDHTDAIVITHEHIDHFDPETVYELQKKTGAEVLTTPFVAKRLRVAPAGRIKTLAVGDSASIKDIELYAGYSYHPGHGPLSFLITANGIRIFHPSDSDAYPGMKQLGETFKPEILLYFGTSLENGVEIAKLIQPNVTMVCSVEPSSLIERFREDMADALPGTGVETLKRFEIHQYVRVEKVVKSS
jgi:L-ascorbate metabolism protein UlaG (beta-lactamase superfamily)